MSEYALSLQIAFSLCVIVAFGYRQFNRWTDLETRSESSDVELLAFAQPRSFTSLWRFMSVASLYCLALITLYFLLLILFRSPPSAGMSFLQVTGVTAENAWLVALFVVTGLSPILPVFSNIERSLREVMHAWAVVPTKAQQLADQLASPSTTFAIDKRFFADKVRQRLGIDFEPGDLVEGPAVTTAQKWCRLKFLVCKYAPPLLDGADASGLRSPYTTRFHNDLMTLQAEVLEFSRTNTLPLRGAGESPAAVALLERIDSMLHRLYVLMCCRAFASERSLDDVVQYFSRCYGISVRDMELSSFPTDPILDALFAVTAAVLAVSFGFSALVNDPRVHPIVWAANAFATHGAGLMVGWLVFSRRRRQRTVATAHFAAFSPLSRNLLVACTVLGFALATVPTWLATIYYLQHIPNLTFASTSLLLSTAFLISWPWALLGSATAVAVYVHLERTSNREASLPVLATSAAGQAFANIVISLLVLGLYTAPGRTARPLIDALQDPVIQLVLLLTGTIGLVLGFFLPRVVHGHGLDLRGGATRYRPTAEAATAVFTYGGQQAAVVVQSISLTGCVLRLPNSERLVNGRYGTLLLSDGTNITAHFVRHIEQGEDGSVVGRTQCYAMQFAAPLQRDEVSKRSRQRLGRFLIGPQLVPAV